MEKALKPFIICILLIIFNINQNASANDIADKNGLGPQSKQAIGQKNLLIVVVRFPDAAPAVPIESIRKKAVSAFSAYLVEQSYGLASINADFRGYVMLPDALSAYKVSPYNNQVDSAKVRKLVEDTMTAVESEVDFSLYDHMLIIPAVNTTFGTGYGMVCYCANPGMLTPIQKKKDKFQSAGRVGKYETVRSKGGKEFRGGVFVGAENANLGMFAHDYFHALGGLYEGRRFAPCLYDYEFQSNTSAEWPKNEFYSHISIYMGPWDIMSQHFVKPGTPPPGISSFTKIRLGWIGDDQIQAVKPGETSLSFLSPLSRGGELLVVMIPVDKDTYYLIENRQQEGFDKTLPDSGILILEVKLMPDDGHGPVRVKKAVNSDTFDKATYKLEAGGRNAFVDGENNVAVIPLWKEKDNLGVLVTTPNLVESVVKAALAIQELIDKNKAKSSKETETAIDTAIAAFKNNDFEKSYAIAASK
ncbi:hypothetical protein EPN96_00255 [bacterium]|nr:MAG: hypothetical protein EPN96_00255 [bacterium]